MTLWSTLMYLPSNIRRLGMDKVNEGTAEKWGGICAAAARQRSAGGDASLLVCHPHVLVAKITGFCDCAISSVSMKSPIIWASCAQTIILWTSLPFCPVSHPAWFIAEFVHTGKKTKTHLSVQSIISDWRMAHRGRWNCWILNSYGWKCKANYVTSEVKENVTILNIKCYKWWAAFPFCANISLLIFLYSTMHQGLTKFLSP